MGITDLLPVASPRYGCATRTAGSKTGGQCGTPTSRKVKLGDSLLGRTLRFDASSSREAEHIVWIALTRRVQRTRSRERSSTRSARDGIVSKILHERWEDNLVLQCNFFVDS